MSDERDIARRVLPLLDLTSLNENDDAAAIEALCRRAVTPAGAVAAVCVYPGFVALARTLLAGSGVRIATVANFPEGAGAAETVLLEVADAVTAGADEIDIVMPWRTFLADGTAAGREAAGTLLAAAKAACSERILKVILETGALRDEMAIRAAGRTAVAAGADFLKTSTGKGPPGADPRAARILLGLIREVAERNGRPPGFKAAGGIRTLAQAALYLALADEIMGPRWVSPATFRLGASSLLDDLLRALGRGGTPVAIGVCR